MSSNHKWQIHSTVAFQRVEEGFFVITPDNALHQLQNPVAICLWEKLDEGVSTLEGLITCICDEFEVSPTEAERDIIEFLETGVTRDLLTRVES